MPSKSNNNLKQVLQKCKPSAQSFHNPSLQQQQLNLNGSIANSEIKISKMGEVEDWNCNLELVDKMWIFMSILIENLSYCIGLSFFIYFLKIFGDYVEEKQFSEGLDFPFIFVYVLIFIGILFTYLKYVFYLKIYKNLSQEESINMQEQGVSNFKNSSYNKDMQKQQKNYKQLLKSCVLYSLKGLVSIFIESQWVLYQRTEPIAFIRVITSSWVDNPINEHFTLIFKQLLQIIFYIVFYQQIILFYDYVKFMNPGVDLISYDKFQSNYISQSMSVFWIYQVTFYLSILFNLLYGFDKLLQYLSNRKKQQELQRDLKQINLINHISSSGNNNNNNNAEQIRKSQLPENEEQNNTIKDSAHQMNNDNKKVTLRNSFSCLSQFSVPDENQNEERLYKKYQKGITNHYFIYDIEIKLKDDGVLFMGKLNDNKNDDKTTTPSQNPSGGKKNEKTILQTQSKNNGIMSAQTPKTPKLEQSENKFKSDSKVDSQKVNNQKLALNNLEQGIFLSEKKESQIDDNMSDKLKQQVKRNNSSIGQSLIISDPTFVTINQISMAAQKEKKKQYINNKLNDLVGQMQSSQQNSERKDKAFQSNSIIQKNSSYSSLQKSNSPQMLNDNIGKSLHSQDKNKNNFGSVVQEQIIEQNEDSNQDS